MLRPKPNPSKNKIRDLYLRALLGRARVYQFAGQYPDSRQDLQTVGRVTRDPRYRYEYYQASSILYERLGRFKPAYASLKKAISLSRRYPAMIDEAVIQNAQIHLLIEKGRYHQALKLANDLLKKIKVRGRHQPKKSFSRPDQARLMMNIGNAYLALDDYDQARDFFLQARRFYQRLNNPEGLGVADNNLTLAFWKKGDYRKAMAYSRAALAIRQKIGHRYGISATLNNLGLINDEMGRYQEALEYYEQALNVFRQLNDIYGMTIVLTNIGSIYQEVYGDWNRALGYYRRSLELVRQTGDAYGEAEAILTMADMYWQHKNRTDFQRLIKSAGRMMKTVSSKELILTYYLALIKMHGWNHNRSEVNFWIHKTINYLNRSASRLLRIETLAALIDLLDNLKMNTGQYKISHLVKDMAQVWQKLESPLKRVKILRSLVKYYLQVSDQERASLHFQAWQDTAHRYAIKAHFLEIQRLRRKIILFRKNQQDLISKP